MSGIKKGISEKMAEMDKVRVLMSNKTEPLKKEISYYRDNDVCSVCHQDINEHFKEEKIKCNQDSLANYWKVKRSTIIYGHCWKKTSEK